MPAAGVVVMAANVVATTYTYRGRRVPRLGFRSPDTAPAVLLVVLAARRLTTTDDNRYLLVLAALGVVLLSRIVVVLVRNRRVPA